MDTKNEQPRSGLHPRASSVGVSGTRKRKLPFGFNPRAAKRHAKFKRAQAGMTKAEIEQANARAIAEHEQARHSAERA